MGKLICVFPDHSGEVVIDADCFRKVQKAVNDHFAGVPVGQIYGVLGQNSPNWHITPSGPDWHIGPGA
jgi:hypothetical protein